MTMTSSVSGLARQLRELRRARYTTGSAFARRLHWSQSRVSKIETGAKVPSREELVAWIDHTVGDRSTASALWRAWDEARAEQEPPARARPRPGLGDGDVGYPERMIERVQRDLRAATIMEYQPSLMPSILATGEYMAAAFRTHLELLQLSDDDVERTLAQRERQQRRLLDGGVETCVVLEEAVLYNDAPGQRVLVRQLDRLQQLVRSLPNLDVAVHPSSAEPIPVTSTNFTIHDRARVHVQGVGCDFTVDEPTRVAPWLRAFEAAQQRSARGPEALALIAEAQRRLLRLDASA
jgi:transcriptional regulator with XRE-family HTH domain